MLKGRHIPTRVSRQVQQLLMMLSRFHCESEVLPSWTRLFCMNTSVIYNSHKIYSSVQSHYANGQLITQSNQIFILGPNSSCCWVATDTNNTQKQFAISTRYQDKWSPQEYITDRIHDHIETFFALGYIWDRNNKIGVQVLWYILIHSNGCWNRIHAKLLNFVLIEEWQTNSPEMIFLQHSLFSRTQLSVKVSKQPFAILLFPNEQTQMNFLLSYCNLHQQDTSLL